MKYEEELQRLKKRNEDSASKAQAEEQERYKANKAMEQSLVGDLYCIYTLLMMVQC